MFQAQANFHTKCKTLQHHWSPSEANSLICLQVGVLCCTYQCLCSRSRDCRSAAAWAAGLATARPAWAGRAVRAGRRRKACGGGGGAAGPQGEEPQEAQHRGPAGLHVPGWDLEAQSHRSAACLTWPHPCLEGRGGKCDELTQSLSVLLLCVNLLENWFQRVSSHNEKLNCSAFRKMSSSKVCLQLGNQRCAATLEASLVKCAANWLEIRQLLPNQSHQETDL